MTREGEAQQISKSETAHTGSELQRDLRTMLQAAVFDPERNGTPDAVVVQDQHGHTYEHVVDDGERAMLEAAAWSENDGGLQYEALAGRIVRELPNHGFDTHASDLELTVSLRRG